MNVLIVEDVWDAALALKKLLEQHGAIVSISGTLAGAKEEAARFCPDVVYLDAGLPDTKTPLETIERNAEIGCDCPAKPIVVVTSAESDETLVTAAFKYGCTDFILKDKDSNVVERVIYAYFRKLYARPPA